MFWLSVRCSLGCFFILASVHADSFRPIANPNVGHRSTAKRIPITAAPRTTTIAATFRPLTTISATLKAQKPTAKSRPLPAITTAQPTGKAKDSAKSDSKDAPVAEAWYADFNHLRRRRRPYFGNKYFLNTPFNAPFGFGSSRPRRRPLPRPYFPQPAYFGYNSPYEDYRFETDFLDPSATYSGSRPTKPKVPIDSGSIGEYGGGGGGGGSDGEITQYYDPSSATFHVGSGYKSHDGSSSGGSGYYSSGKGSSSLGSSGAGSSSLGGAGTGTGVAYEYTTDSDDGYKFTSKPKGKGTRSPTKSKTRYRFNTYTPDTDSGYKYSSGGDTSGYGTSASGGGGGGDQLLDIDDTSSTDPDPYSQSKYLYPTKNVVYQTAPKASKPKAVKSTTYTPPIKISDSSIDILTKPLGSATFNLNLSPGTVYQPPAISYNPIGSAYKPIQAIQPIPIQPPATSYGVPIGPPLNTYSYPNPYQPQLNAYPANGQSNYLTHAGHEQGSGGYAGRFAEPPSLGRQQLSETDASYSNNQQSSYDATPKSRPTKRHRSPAKPTLPNAYDQEDFHAIGAKNKRKSQHRPGATYYHDDDRHRSTTRKPTVTLRIPDEDYVDDLVKVVQTTKRPKKKLAKSTPAHTLDTDDLREAYDSDVPYYPKSKHKTKIRFKNNRPSGDYDIEEEPDNYDDYDNERVSHAVGTRDAADEKRGQDKDTDADQSSQSSSYWDKDSSIYKQYGIKARNDYFQANNRFRLEQQATANGFRPIRGEDRSDLFAENPTDGKGHYLHDIGIVAEGGHSSAARTASTVRPATTAKTTTLFVWDGKSLPKNHKLV